MKDFIVFHGGYDRRGRPVLIGADKNSGPIHIEGIEIKDFQAENGQRLEQMTDFLSSFFVREQIALANLIVSLPIENGVLATPEGSFDLMWTKQDGPKVGDPTSL